MKKNVYSIHDEKAKAYTSPFFLNHNGEAIRAFEDIATDPKTAICKHKADYRLYRIAEYDDVKGEFVQLKQPEMLMHALGYEPISKKEV